MTKIIILGDRPNCGLCQNLYGISAKQAKKSVDVSKTKVVLAIKAAYPSAEFIDGDKTLSPAAYKANRPKGGFKFPSVRVVSDCALPVTFVARGMKPKDVVAAIKAKCPSCSEDGCAERNTYRTHP